MAKRTNPALESENNDSKATEKDSEKYEPNNCVQKSESAIKKKRIEKNHKGTH